MEKPNISKGAASSAFYPREASCLTAREAQKTLHKPSEESRITREETAGANLAGQKSLETKCGISYLKGGNL